MKRECSAAALDAVNSAAAPATVSGKPRSSCHCFMALMPRDGKAGRSVRAASQETCRSVSPIVRAGRAEERRHCRDRISRETCSGDDETCLGYRRSVVQVGFGPMVGLCIADWTAVVVRANAPGHCACIAVSIPLSQTLREDRRRVEEPFITPYPDCDFAWCSAAGTCTAGACH